MAWARRGPRVVIGVPHTGSVPVEWAVAAMALEKPPHTTFIFNRGAPIDVTRELIVDEFLQGPAEWLLFFDTDVIPPRDALMRLLSHNLPIVSALYYRRHAEPGRPLHPAMWRLIREGEEARCPTCGEARRLPVGRYLPITEYPKGLVEVDAVGLGFCLIHRRVFEVVERKCGRPFFLWTHGREKLFNAPVGVSEDFFFTAKVREAGFKVLVDTTVVCGHLGPLVVEEGGVVRSPRY